MASLSKATRTSTTSASQAVFTARQRKAVIAYVAYLQKVLRVSDWHIDIDFSDPSPDALADISAPPNQKWATLRLGSGFLELPEHMQTQTLIHEVSHCTLFALHDTVSDIISSGVKNRPARKISAAMANSAVESVTDHFADVLLPLVKPLVLT